MNELIKNYMAAKESIGEMFDIAPVCDFEYHSLSWYYYNAELSWVDNDDYEYSEDAILVGQTPDYKLFLVNSCTGDQFYMIVESGKENEAPDFEEGEV